MAAVDRRNPNLDDFVGLNWSCWTDGVNILPSDAVSETDDSSKYGRSLSETMTLRKEDMHIYGHCPAHDEIYLVVCSLCGQVVKPQAFEKHCERRHGPITKILGQSSAFTSQQRPRPSRPSSSLSSSQESRTDNRCHEASAPSSPALPAHQRISTKAQKETVSFPLMEKFPQETSPPLPLQPSSKPRPRVPLWPSGLLPPSHCSSSASLQEKSSAQKPTAVRSRKSQSPLRESKTYSRVHKNNDEKECDLNKHCGLLDPERKRQSSRELICNTDSIQQQQKALGRTKTFEKPTVEPKKASAGRNMEQLLVKTKDNMRLLGALEEKITTQGSKYNFNSSYNILRSRGQSESFRGEEGASTVEVEVEVQPPYPFNQTLLSSDEDEQDNQEETTDLPATPWHPKPLGLCTFGCRTFGCSIFTFDRRWHHLRFALSAMLEHHVGGHLWKKMPQVSSGLRSCHTPSPVRTGSRPPKSTGALNADSTSLSQTDTKISQHYTHSTKPPSSTPASQSTGRRCSNPAGRCGKAQVREMELMRAAKCEDKSSKHIKDTPLHENSQPLIPSSNGPVNGSFLDGKKPCPPLQEPPNSRRKPPWTQQKVIDCERTGPGQKRKGNNESLSLPRSRNSKYQRLSSAWSLEKRADP